jgi:hypothetical protein
MKKPYLIYLIIIMIGGCVRSRGNYSHTSVLKSDSCNCKLYVEVFVSSFNGLRSSYLTDSVNFRLFAGNFDDEKENMSYKCSGDQVTIEKDERVDEVFKIDSSFVDNKLVTTPNLNYKVKRRKKYFNISDLRKKQVFE